MNKYPTENILNFDVYAGDLTDCTKCILEYIHGEHHRPFFLSCINPHSIEVSSQDSYFKEALHNSTLLIPDGFGIVLASKLFGGQVHDRITGSDIFNSLNHGLNYYKDHSCFFLGSTESTLKTISERMSAEYPNIEIRGVYSPPFKDIFDENDNEQILEAINQAKPDVLWVGMTAPKQEKWIDQNLDKLNVKFVGAIGAVFDFYAGNIKRSHPLFQKVGLEWLPRLIREPRRLWRRNFISTPKFLYRVLTRKNVI